MKKIEMIIRDCYECPYRVEIGRGEVDDYGASICSLLCKIVGGKIPSDCQLMDVERPDLIDEFKLCQNCGNKNFFDVCVPKGEYVKDNYYGCGQWVKRDLERFH